MQIADDVPSLIRGQLIGPADHRRAGNAHRDHAEQQRRRAIDHRLAVADRRRGWRHAHARRPIALSERPMT
jgi:hypothetical protein